MNSNQISYQSNTRLRDIIAEDNHVLMALTRFGIPLGFGDKTVGEVCSGATVDVDTFLAVVNLIVGRRFSTDRVKLPSLVDYLKQAHNYFLDFILPSIRRKLIEAISSTDTNDVAFLIMKFYDDYVVEVRRHMEYENNHVFTYVDQLMSGKVVQGFKIADFEANHKPIASKLKELKEIFIYHYSATNGRIDLLNSVLFDIINCERDLMSHCQVEDRIFVPAVETLEYASRNNFQVDEVAPNVTTANITDLSEREKDIIRLVARGLSNKEIADNLYLSVHTVATHRRNICAKLGIHSTSGLTIFAIIHKLIDLKDIRHIN